MQRSKELKYSSNKTPAEKPDCPVSILGNEDLGELSSFFDLLAKYDCEDKLKEKSELKTGSLGIQLPRGSVLGSDI